MTGIKINDVKKDNFVFLLRLKNDFDLSLILKGPRPHYHASTEM
jgi:hypothetical protein